MTEQEIDLDDPQVLHRAARHLAGRYAGVFFPALVERCLAQVHAARAATARSQPVLAPIAVHAAGNRPAALARVITLGLHGALLVSPGAMVQDWPPGLFLDEVHDPSVVADLDHRLQDLWAEIMTSAAATPPRQGPRS
ncbi:hypothetical protein [Kocuria nitroreducens]|uniref:hypothetical protein n=1 Tax=Kocuria nitroreducens TaxID=3058914 RepID=UPI0036DB2D02